MKEAGVLSHSRLVCQGRGEPLNIVFNLKLWPNGLKVIPSCCFFFLTDTDISLKLTAWSLFSSLGTLLLLSFQLQGEIIKSRADGLKNEQNNKQKTIENMRGTC